MHIGTTAKQLREALGWTQRETADALHVSYVHLCNVENNKTQPSQALLDRFRELWGIDLYVFAWCKQGDGNQLPSSVRGAAVKLANAWQKQVDLLISTHRRCAEVPCSTSET